MRAAVAAAVAGGTVIAAALLAGCGPAPVSGDAEAAGVAAGEPVFSPCDDIPDEVLRGIGMDPATESRDILGVKQPGWNICGWQGDRYSVSIFASTHRLVDLRANPKFEAFFDVDVDGRSALGYREVADRTRERCDVAVETQGGAVLVSIGFRTLTPPRDAEEPCAIAADAVRRLNPALPE
ncbi:DUF3558 domain-containing protein [Rhodococcus sp. NPDC054953]